MFPRLYFPALSAAPPPAGSVPVLVVVDSEDGTGAVATVSGTDAGSANVIYTAALEAGNGVIAWTAAGSRTGDGPVNLPTLGAFYAYVVGTVATVQAASVPIIYFATASTRSVQEQCEAAVQAKLQTLTLAGATTPPGTIPPGRVYRYPAFVPQTLDLITLPAVVVTTGSGAETQEGYLTGRDDIGYPVGVFLVDRAPPSDPRPFPAHRLFRQQVFRVFRNQRLSGVPTVFLVKGEPGAVLNWEPERYSLVVSSITLRCISRESRGV